MTDTQQNTTWPQIAEKQIEPTWQVELFPQSGGQVVIIGVEVPPMWIHRKMQELVFGIKWEKLK